MKFSDFNFATDLKTDLKTIVGENNTKKPNKSTINSLLIIQLKVLVGSGTKAKSELELRFLIFYLAS